MEQSPQEFERSPGELSQTTDDPSETPDIASRFVSEGPESLQIHVSPDTAQKIQEKQGGVLPSNVHIRED